MKPYPDTGLPYNAILSDSFPEDKADPPTKCIDVTVEYAPLLYADLKSVLDALTQRGINFGPAAGFSGPQIFAHGRLSRLAEAMKLDWG